MEKVLEWFAKLPPAVKIAAGAVGVVLMAVLYYVLSYADAETQLARLRGQISKADATLIQKQAFAQNLNKVQKQVARLEAEVEEAKANLPSTPEMSELLRRLSDLAEKSGLSIELFTPGAEKVQGFYAEVPVQMRLVGAYHEVLSFFYSVSKLPRIVNIADVQLTAPAIRDKKVTVTAACLATTFRLLSAEERARYEAALKEAELKDKKKKKKGGGGE